MVQMKVFTKKEYVELIPRVTTGDYERLKKSIKEQGLLHPIIVNQDHVVLDGHHRLRVCNELKIPVEYEVKSFVGKPLAELKYVVTVNVDRRQLDEFQRAEIALKMDKIARQLAIARKNATSFNPDTAKAAAKARWEKDREEKEEERSVSGDTNHIFDSDDDGEEEQEEEDEIDYNQTRSAKELGDTVGVSSATIERVRKIMDQGTPEQIQSLKQKSETGEGPGVRTVYNQVMDKQLKDKLAENQPKNKIQINNQRENIRIYNKDFRTITQQEVPNESADVVLALTFPDSQNPDDTITKLQTSVMNQASQWLKDGGFLVMHVPQELWMRALHHDKPPILQFYRCIAVNDNIGFWENQRPNTIFENGWTPIFVYVKGTRDTKPITPQASSTDLLGHDYDSGEDKKAFAITLIKSVSPSNAVIVDPFMNKGEVGLAAVDLGRKYYGIEKETTRFLTAMDALYSSSNDEEE